MAKTWDDFVPLAAPHLPGCPLPSIRLYLAQTAADFLARTYLWRQDIDPIYTSPGVSEYDLDAPALVESVLAVYNEDRTLERTDLRYLDPGRRGETGDPKKYWIANDRAIGIWPTPDKQEIFNVTAVLKLSRSATGVEDWIYETWADAIVSGAVYRLAITPGKEWSDAALATFHRGIFEKAIVDARIRDHRWAPLTVQMQPFA
jgi:hypothetical protein